MDAHVPATGGLVLSVANGGVPIAPATLQALFQPFWRGDHSGASGGLGLGHHGAMEVTSTADATTFRFRMPAAAPATAHGAGPLSV